MFLILSADSQSLIAVADCTAESCRRQLKMIFDLHGQCWATPPIPMDYLS